MAFFCFIVGYKFKSLFGMRCIEFKEEYVPDTYDIDQMSIHQLLQEIDLLDNKFT